MKIVYFDVNDGLADFLLRQDGINKVEISKKDFLFIVEIEGSVSSYTVANYIDSFQKSEWPEMFGFDKKENVETKELHYSVADVCCEFCYRGFIDDLFRNEKIISVKSDYSVRGANTKINYVICYNSKYDEADILKKINYVL